MSKAPWKPQDDPPDPAVIGVDQELAECPTGVVADQRHVGQAELGHEVVDHPGNGPRAEVGVGVHRLPV